MKDLTQLQVIQKAAQILPGYSAVEQTLNTLNVLNDHKYGSGKRMYNEVYGWSSHHATYREALAEMEEKMASQKKREEVEKAGSVQ